MSKPTTPLAIVQFKQLTTEAREALLTEVFEALEYDHDDNPGSEGGSDTLQAVYETFNDAGVKFTRVDDVPAGYRINDHRTDTGTWCRWSLCPVVEPLRRAERGNIHCPFGCTGSVVEADPNRNEDNDDQVDVEQLVAALNGMSVPSRLTEHRDDEFTLLVGEGEYDEANERFTHRVQAGPIYRDKTKVYALTDEFSYSRYTPAGDEADSGVAAEVDIPAIVKQIVMFYMASLTATPPSST